MMEQEHTDGQRLFLEQLKSEIQSGQRTYLTEAQLQNLQKMDPNFEIDRDKVAILPSAVTDVNKGDDFSGNAPDSSGSE